ncbi:MAG: GNAT family N-acetyltransferase [Turicibacter sp.]
MEIKRLTIQDAVWAKTIETANNCSWGAGPNLGQRMKENKFEDFECPFAAIKDNEVVGFCTITKTDYIPNCSYTPWIGFVFVDEHHRGSRISQKMINEVLAYAKLKEFNKVYISTEEENLYEKYGFVQIDSLKSYDHKIEKILMYELG